MKAQQSTSRINDIVTMREARLKGARESTSDVISNDSISTHPWVADPIEQYEQRMSILDVFQADLIDITEGGRFFNQHPDGEMGSDSQKASQSAPSLPHKERLHTHFHAPFCDEHCPVHLHVEHFENPNSLPWRVERTRWHPGLLTASPQEYREYVASCVELEMQTSIYGYWCGARLNILSNLVSLFRALVAEVQLYRHRLTHGLSPECNRLRVIDKSLWLSRFVKWLLKVPSNPYPWIDEICKSQQGVESGHSVSAGAEHVSG